MHVRYALLLLLLLFLLMPHQDVSAQSHQLTLESLTISPEPSFWDPGPWGPENRDIVGHFGDSSPEEIVVTAVPQDSGVTITIGGRSATAGAPLTFAWDSETETLCIDVQLSAPDGSSGYYGLSLTKFVHQLPATLESLTLESLTLSPSPASWHPGPVRPGDYYNGGEHQADYRGMVAGPETISVAAVTSDPEATFTINGQLGVNGEPMTFHWSRWTPWLDLNVDITDPDGSSGRYRILLWKDVNFPTITVDKSGGQVAVYGLDPSSTATMTVRDAPGGAVFVEATTTIDAVFGDFRWDFPDLGIPVLLQKGMEVSVTDGDVTVTHVVLSLSIDEVDVDNDTVRGTGVPGAGIEIWGCTTYEASSYGEIPECIGMEFHFGDAWLFPEGDGPNYDPRFPRFVVDASGHWEVDLSLADIDLTSESILDVGSAAWNPYYMNWDLDDLAALAAWDPFNKGSRTITAWPPEVIEPTVAALFGLNAIMVESVGSGVSVDLTVHSSAGGLILFADTQQADAEGNAIWGFPSYPELDIILEPGMEVTAAWEQISTSGVLDDLTVENVDPDLDRVSGTGPAGETIIVFVGDFSNSEPYLVAVAEEILIGPDGSWQADFAEDITVGIEAVALLSVHSTFRTGAAAVAVVSPEVIEETPVIAEASDETEVVVETVASDGSLAQVTVPANALPSGSSVRVAAITNTEDLIEQVAVPEGTDLALGFSISAQAADGSKVTANFTVPVAVEFTVTADAMPTGYDPDSLSIAFWNGARWVSLDGVQAAENPDGSVTLMAMTDHFTLFTVVADPANIIKPGPADPLEEVSLSGFRSLGLDISPASPEGQQAGSEDGGGLVSLPAWIGGGVAVLLVAGWIILRSRKQTSQS